MKLTRQHTLWIVILAILAGIVLFIMRAKVAGATDARQVQWRQEDL